MKQLPIINILSFLSEKQKEQSSEINLPNKNLESINDIGSCSKLKKINFSNNKITQYKELNSCKEISWANLSQNQINSMADLSNLTKLTVLNLSHNTITRISGLEKLLNLKALILNDNKIEEITGLHTLKRLNTLVLSSNYIKEIKGLEELKELKKLSLSHNKIKAFSGLKTLAYLFDLKLNDNQITFIPEELKFNKFLRILDIGKNNIKNHSDIEKVNELTSISNLNYSGNPFENSCDHEDLQQTIVSLCPSIKIINNKIVEANLRPKNNQKKEKNGSDADTGSKRRRKRREEEKQLLPKTNTLAQGENSKELSLTIKKKQKLSDNQAKNIDLNIDLIKDAHPTNKEYTTDNPSEINKKKKPLTDPKTLRTSGEITESQLNKRKTFEKQNIAESKPKEPAPLQMKKKSIKEGKRTKILNQVLGGAKTGLWD